MGLEIVKLDGSLEDKYLAFVGSDPIANFFFIVDWKYLRDRTAIHLALEDGDIKAVMLVYNNVNVQFRGERGAIEALFRVLDLKEVETLVDEDLCGLVEGSYDIELKRPLILMSMGRDDLTLHTKGHEVGELVLDDANSIVELLKENNPAPWAEWTLEGIRQTFLEDHWVGIKVDGRIVSVAMSRSYDFASNIHLVATEEAHRNKGYATSVVGEMVSWIFRTSETALIHVFSDNGPAVKAYRKVGFRPYRHFMLLRGKRKG